LYKLDTHDTKNLGHALNHVFLSYKRVESMTVVNSTRNG